MEIPWYSPELYLFFEKLATLSVKDKGDFESVKQKSLRIVLCTDTRRYLWSRKEKKQVCRMVQFTSLDSNTSSKRLFHHRNTKQCRRVLWYRTCTWYHTDNRCSTRYSYLSYNMSSYWLELSKHCRTLSIVCIDSSTNIKSCCARLILARV